MPPVKRKAFSEDEMLTAVELVNSGLSIRLAAKSCGLSNETVGRYFRKQRGLSTAIRMVPNFGHKLIFNKDQEDSLMDYLIACAKQYYGLPLSELLKLAYEMAIVNNIKVPENWHKLKMAGEKWYRGFRARHPKLSLRTPEGCSLSRATSFNKHNVNVFFDNLFEVCNRSSHFACGTRIFNLDETATTTVHVAPKVLALKGVRQVNKVTSGERGVLVHCKCYRPVSSSSNGISASFFQRSYAKWGPIWNAGLSMQVWLDEFGFIYFCNGTLHQVFQQFHRHTNVAYL